MFARMYNRGGFRRCALCGPGLGQTLISPVTVGGPPRGLGQTMISPVMVGGPPRGLGMIPVATRFSYADLRVMLQNRAHAARTASAAGWPQAEANLLEAVEAGESLYRGGYAAAIGTRLQWEQFLETLGNAAWALTSQRRERFGEPGGSVMVWEGEPDPVPSPLPTTPRPRPPTPTLPTPPAPGGKPGAAPAPGAPGIAPPVVSQAGIGAMLRSPWTLLGVLGVGAVVAVWYATSIESPPPRKKGKK